MRKILVVLFAFWASAACAQIAPVGNFTAINFGQAVGIGGARCQVRTGTGTPTGGNNCDVVYQTDSPYSVWHKVSGTWEKFPALSASNVFTGTANSFASVLTVTHATAPAFALTKTNATAQSWGIGYSSGLFSIFDTTAVKYPIQIANGADTNLLYLSGHYVGLGATAPLYNNASANERIMSIQGVSTFGQLELGTLTADADGPSAGYVLWSANGNTSASTKMVSYIGTQVAGATANHRGGRLYFSTKPNNSNTFNATTMEPDGSWTFNGVALINASGKIPAISSTYFTSLSGANLTGLSFANIAPLANDTYLQAKTFGGVTRNVLGLTTSDLLIVSPDTDIGGMLFNTSAVFKSGYISINGSSTGNVTFAVPAAASGTITFPAGTTDFSSTGGTSRVLRQSSAGAAITVSQLSSSDLSDGPFSPSFFSSAVPTVNTGFGGSGTIAGRASAFTVTISGVGSQNGTVDFNTTFTTAPACVATPEMNVGVAPDPVSIIPTTTQVGIKFTTGVNVAKVHVICLSKD